MAISVVLSLIQVGTYLSAVRAYRSEPVLRLANAIHAEEPFAVEEFKRNYDGQAARQLARVVAGAAASIVDAPNARRWRYLLRYLQPLDEVWADVVPLQDVLARHKKRLDARADAWETDRGPVFGEAWRKHVFGPSAPAVAAAAGAVAAAAGPASKRRDPSRPLRALAAKAGDAPLTRFEELRLAAFCARERSRAKMRSLAGDLKADAAFGRAVRDIGTTTGKADQACVAAFADRADVCGGDGFRAFFDEEVCATLLRGVAKAHLAPFEARLRALFPRVDPLVESAAGQFKFPHAVRDKEVKGADLPASIQKASVDSMPDDPTPPHVKRGVALRRALSWQGRVHLKCAASVSVKSHDRTRAKVKAYASSSGSSEKDYPYAKLVSDPLRATLICDDAEALDRAWRTLKEGSGGSLELLRAKNKLGSDEMPFNVHGNFAFSDPSVAGPPVVVEIQLWSVGRAETRGPSRNRHRCKNHRRRPSSLKVARRSTHLFVLNDVSHWQYEVARAERFGDVSETRTARADVAPRPAHAPEEKDESSRRDRSSDDGAPS